MPLIIIDMKDRELPVFFFFIDIQKKLEERKIGIDLN